MLSFIVATLTLTQSPGAGANADAQFRKLQSLAKNRIRAEQTATDKNHNLLTVKIDQRIELLTNIFRLAGNEEFVGSGIPAYANYIDARFAKFKSHPAVALARKVREERYVCCDAVVSLAIHLGDLPKLDVRAPLEGGTLEQRWRPDDASTMANLAQDFAKVSRFEEFLRESKPLYELTELRMRRLVSQRIDPEWFARYFGERPQAKFIVAPGLLNGSISYGMSVRPRQGKEEMFASMGTWHFDSEGLPVYDDDTASTIVHEFNHSFIGPHLTAKQEDLRTVGEAAKAKVAELVPGMGYFHWKTLIEETLVRGVVARYILARQGKAQADAEINLQIRNGFLWTDDVFALLDEYENHRDEYPTFVSFFPRVREYFATLPTVLPAKAERFDAVRPKVKTSTPADGAEGVDPNLTEIRVTFDQPMDRSAYAVVPASRSAQTLPKISKQGFDPTGTVFTIQVSLKPGSDYELWLNSPTASAFRNAQGILMKPHRIRFRTAE